MSRPVQLPPAGFEDLSVEEQIDYVQALWERIAANDTDVPVPEWHRDILDERLAEFRKDPDSGRAWQDVKADLDRRRRQK